jgi:hypothetical protein
MPLTSRLLCWTPRILAGGTVIYAAWLGVLANGAYIFLALGSLLALLLGWFWPARGGAAFITLGIFYLLAFGAQPEWAGTLPLRTGMVLIGLLFLVEWGYRRSMRLLA